MNFGVVVKLIKGRDGVVRAVRLRAGNSFIERAVQQLCPMELSCDIPHKTEEVAELNPRAREFNPRKAAVVARKVTKEIANQEELTI